MQPFTTTGTFPRGIEIAGTTYTQFTMREAFLEDLIDAAADAGGTENGLAFYAEQAVIKTRADFLALRDAQLLLDQMGNGEQSSNETPGT